MLSLKSLKFCNIGRFVAEQEIDFSSLDRIVEVGAQNNNTGGSSGAGKSTIFHAIDYLLGINEIPATALQSRLTKDHLYAEGLFDVGGIQLKIRRSKKDGLYVKFGDEEVSGNVKLAEERLEEIIGIPKKLFKKMVHKKQKEGGFFLNLTAKESYDFLMNALGLGKTSSKVFKIDQDIKKYTEELKELSSSVEYLKKSKQEMQEILSLNKEPEQKYTNEDVGFTQGKIDKLKLQKESLEESVNKSIAKLEKPIKPEIKVEINPEIPKLKEEVVKLQKTQDDMELNIEIKKNKAKEARDSLKSKISEISYLTKEISNLANEMEALMGQRGDLVDNVCPTCSQHWSGDDTEKKLSEINLRIESIKKDIVNKKEKVDLEDEHRANLVKVDDIILRLESNQELEDLRNKKFEARERLIELEAEQDRKASKLENEYLNKLNLYNSEVNSIKDSKSKDIDSVVSDINNLDKKLSEIKYSIGSYVKQKEEYLHKKEKIETSLKEKQKEIDNNLVKINDSVAALGIAEESKRALKTYTLQIFQDTLDYIGSYATEILSNIPNMTGTTVYFEGCKETKSGNIKDEVNAIINMDGYNNVNIKTLSGGERTAIDLAVDLAVIDMIESKAGKGADFFIMDEPFDGLEEINISQCLEILQQVDTNKKIIIVDHNPIAKEMINDRIIVQRDGEESVVL